MVMTTSNGWTRVAHLLIMIGCILIIIVAALTILGGLGIAAGGIANQLEGPGFSIGVNALIFGIILLVIGVLVAALELQKWPDPLQVIVDTPLLRGVVMLVIAVVLGIFSPATFLIGLGGILYIVGHFL